MLSTFVRINIMIGFITNIAPIMLGFVGKLFALKQQAASENQKLMMEQFAAKDKSINQARAAADKESPMAAMNRRVITRYPSSNYIHTSSTSNL